MRTFKQYLREDDSGSNVNVASGSADADNMLDLGPPMKRQPLEDPTKKKKKQPNPPTATNKK